MLGFTLFALSGLTYACVTYTLRSGYGPTYYVESRTISVLDLQLLLYYRSSGDDRRVSIIL